MQNGYCALFKERPMSTFSMITSKDRSGHMQ